MEQEDVREPKVLSPWWLVAAIIIIAGLCVGYWFLLSHQIPVTANQGTFGDMFGGLNALFSGCAFAGVIYAIFVQRAEIRFAKAELAQTKRIFREQSESLDLQNAETKKQIFENTFFQLLRLHSEITNNLDLTSNGKPSVTGKDVFRVFSDRLNERHSRLLRENSSAADSSAYLELYRREKDDLSHYFTSFWNLLLFVECSEIEEKNFYIRTIRDTLSQSELRILMHHVASKFGSREQTGLVNSYALLENYSVSQTFDREIAKKFSPKAFGKS